MTGRCPTALEGPTQTVAKAVMAVCEYPEWWDLTVKQALGVMMKATGGQINPKNAERTFRTLVSERALRPLER